TDADRSDKESRLRSRQAIFRGIELGSSKNAVWSPRSSLQAKKDMQNWYYRVINFAREATARANLGNAREQGHTCRP
ncbi:MAG TPA: hypothetical protein VFP29_05715, partial [Methyloceanibacter sp.]|nr:hypothetical protein [Methyloceanibacter sp.]